VRNPVLTAAAEKVLKRMITAEDEDDCGYDESELTYDPKANAWWNGLHRVSRKTGLLLLQLCLIRRAEWTGATEIYTAYPEAKKVLEDPNYRPEILKHLAKV
jgi:hypothetical protein